MDTEFRVAQRIILLLILPFKFLFQCVIVTFFLCVLRDSPCTQSPFLVIVLSNCLQLAGLEFLRQPR